MPLARPPQTRGFRPAIFSRLLPGRNYPWPGKVRKLEQAARRILLTKRYEGDHQTLAPDLQPWLSRVGQTVVRSAILPQDNGPEAGRLSRVWADPRKHRVVGGNPLQQQLSLADALAVPLDSISI